MNVRWILVLGLIFVLSAMAPRVRADDKSVEDQYLALAAQRTKAELAARKSLQVFDVNKSGWNDATIAVNELRDKIANVFAKAVRAEQAKAEGDRNQALIDELNGQLQQLDQDWAAYSRERDSKGTAYQELAVLAQNARNVYENLVQDERAWKDAGMDLPTLGGNYDLIVRTLDTAIGKGQELVDEMKTRQKDWEAKLAAAIKATGVPAK